MAVVGVRTDEAPAAALADGHAETLRPEPTNAPHYVPDWEKW